MKMGYKDLPSLAADYKEHSIINPARAIRQTCRACIRIRAERRLGEMLRVQKETGGLRGPQHSTGGGSKGSKREPLPSAPPTLSSVGIDKKLSSRAQNVEKAVFAEGRGECPQSGCLICPYVAQGPGQPGDKRD